MVEVEVEVVEGVVEGVEGVVEGVEAQSFAKSFSRNLGQTTPSVRHRTGLSTTESRLQKSG